jgi:hypothetical protein
MPYKNKEDKAANNRAWTKNNREKRRAHTSAWAKRNPDKTSGYARAYGRKTYVKTQRAAAVPKDASYYRLKRYGLSKEAYSALLDKQDGKCAICREEIALHVDHDHATGDVRGLLCRACNNGIGNFADDPARLQAAIDYLAPLVQSTALTAGA